MSFNIRKMIRKDIQSVQNIAWVSWHVTYDGIIPSDIRESFLKSAYTKRRLKQRMKHSFFFVSELKDEVVGFAQFTIPDKNGKVTLIALYIYPNNQRKGIGTALLEAGINQIENITEIDLHVERDNTVARQFYEAKGFDIVSKFTEDFRGHVLNTIKMKLTLEK